MSFDLNFGPKDSAVPSIGALKQHFEKSSLFHANELQNGGVQFWYENKATGVYCDFSYSPTVTDDELGQLAASGLSFNLNYIRPSFFAYETMPLVQHFCEHFNLLVEDVQEETVQTAIASQLIDSWKLHNERAVAALSHEQDVEIRYLPEEDATEWWRYMSVKEEIEQSFAEDVFVPTVMILESPEKQMFTMIAWTKGIPQFFPRCDYVLLLRDKKRLFGSKEEVGLVPYAEIMASIRPHLGEYNQANPAIKYLRPDKSADVLSTFQHFTLQPIELSQYSRIAPDDFHDVALI